jgi:hypothetical protein
MQTEPRVSPVPWDIKDMCIFHSYESATEGGDTGHHIDPP